MSSGPGGFALRYPHHPRELLVGYSAPLAPSDEPGREGDRGRLFRQLSLSPVALSASLRIYRLTLASGSDAKTLTDAAAALQARPDLFRYVEPNACVYLEQTSPPSPEDPKRSEQWALDEIEAEDAWQTTGGTVDVTVAVIDSGIATSHPDLGPHLWANPCEPTAGGKSTNGVDDACPGMTKGNDKKDDVHGWNFFKPSADVNDTFDHGSQVAGVIGAVQQNGICIQGLAKEISLMALKVSASDTTHVDRLVEALEYAVDANADVVNASWSTDYSNSLREALVKAGNSGIVVAAAAGHGGTAVDLDTNPSYPCSFQLPNVICVAATTETHKLQGGSSWGVATVHLGAPGDKIFSTSRSSCVRRSGPSLAAPHVAAVAALIRAKCPTATVDEMVNRIVWSGQDTAALQGKTSSGKRLNAKHALAGNCGVFDEDGPG